MKKYIAIDAEIGIGLELFLVIRKNYLFIFLVAILGFVISASYSLMVTPIYASTALIATNSSDDQGSNSLSDLSGLKYFTISSANLLGV